MAKGKSSSGGKFTTVAPMGSQTGTSVTVGTPHVKSLGKPAQTRLRG